MRMIIRVCIAAGLICSGALAQAEGLTFQRVRGEFRPAVEQFPTGYVDWGNGFYYTVSKGLPPKQPRLKTQQMSPALLKAKAKTAAVEGAKAQILMMANNIRVDADATLGELTVAGFKVRIEGEISKYEIVTEGWVEDPVQPYYEVVIKAPLSGVSGQLISSQITKLQTGARGPVEEPPAPAPEAAPPAQPAPPAEPPPAPPAEPGKDEKIQDIKDKAAGAEAEMMLLIDARDTGANAALFPEVQSEDGADLFDITLPDKVKTKHEQMVKYVATDKNTEELNRLFEGRRDVLLVQALPVRERVVLAPVVEVVPVADGDTTPAAPRARFTTKATSSAGRLKANIVVSKEDAKKIAEANNQARFFENANVYVIMDSSIGGTEGFRLVPLDDLLSRL
ncbi:MAG: hypothetical protein ABIF71_01855 [Planctomycetota bacterium]